MKPSGAASSRRSIARLESHEIFRQWVKSVTDYALFVLDPEGYIGSWNSGAERLKGYTADEIIGRHFTIFYTAADLAAGKPADELRIAGETGRFEDEGWRVRKDGSRFWANVLITRVNDTDGSLLGFGKITRDLTERRQAELRYRLLVDAVTDYAIFSLDPTGRITSWNSGAQRIKGYNANEIIGKHFSVFYEDEDRRAGLPARVLSTAEQTGHFEGEGWRMRKDGTRFWASVVVTALRDEEGNLYGFSKVTRDISDRKALMDELRRHSHELELRVAERDQSNAELEAFAYSVSHDLRAPLRAISGFSEALEEDYKSALDSTGKEYISEIKDAVGRMNSLVQDLLEYGRVSRISIPLDAVDLSDAVNDARRQIGNVPGAVKIAVPPGTCVRGHRQVLAQVIFNLLSNAVKFNPPDVTPDVTVVTEPKQGFVRLSVTDKGIGIAPEHQDRIWNVFERLHDRDTFMGTGIGLAIVKRAVTRMGGSCGVQSQAGQGATFWIDLPVV